MLGIIKRERTCCLRWYFLYRSEIIAGFAGFVKTLLIHEGHEGARRFGYWIERSLEIPKNVPL